MRFFQREPQYRSDAARGDENGLAGIQVDAEVGGGFRRNGCGNFAADGDGPQACAALGHGTEREAGDQNANDEIQGVGLGFRQGHFHREKNHKRHGHQPALIPEHFQILIEGAGTEVDRDCAHHADGIKLHQRKLVRRKSNDERWQQSRDEQRHPGHPV